MGGDSEEKKGMGNRDANQSMTIARGRRERKEGSSSLPPEGLGGEKAGEKTMRRFSKGKKEGMEIPLFTSRRKKKRKNDDYQKERGSIIEDIPIR